MPGERQKRDFIRFIQDIAINQKLAVEFLSLNDADELGDFFERHNYDVPENDCEDILFTRKRMEGLNIPKNTKLGLAKIGPIGEMYPIEREIGPMPGGVPGGPLPGNKWPWPCGPKKAY
jgi:hypothetical protein